MPRPQKKRVSVKSLRTKLGWTQMDFAYFLDISIKEYSKIEKKIRGADPALIDKINLVRESVYHLEAMGMLGQAVNPT